MQSTDSTSTWPTPVWLASYPRSGNTFLRTVLWHCFGLRSSSVYPNDLAGNAELAKYIGHIESVKDKGIPFPPGALPLIKTHEPIAGATAKYFEDFPRAIYVIRDGRAACVSLWHFYKKQFPLEMFIEGRTRFGTWSSHVESWNPWQRANTLLLEYEDLNQNLSQVLPKLRDFLGRDIVSHTLPDRSTIAGVDGRFVRNASDWRETLHGAALERFEEINGATLRRAGYLSLSNDHQ